MSCIYILYDSKTGEQKQYTYKELVKLYNDGNYRDVSDIIYSKGSKQDAVISQVLQLNKECRVQTSKDINNGEPDYTNGSKYTTQTLIDSGLFRVQGERIIPEQNDENYIENAARAFIQEQGLSWDSASEGQKAEARQKAENIRQNWEIINEDAKELHAALNSFNFSKQDRYDFINKLKGTRFENFASSIYDEITKKNGLLTMLRSTNKLSNDTTVKILQNINLLGKLNTTGDDILGHIDNLVIDTDGVLHIYNYKVTSTPISEWNAVKIEKYKYQMALLKQLLAYHGFNVSGTELHIIPIRLNYSEDFSTITNVIPYLWDKHIKISQGQSFEKYERAAKYFIKSNIKLEPIKNVLVQKINNNLRCFFPERNIRLEGISKSIDDWIKHEFTTKWQGRIKKVDAPDHAYEVYLDDERTDPIFITSPKQPLENEELRKVIQEYLENTQEATNKFISSVVRDIRGSRRAGRSLLGRGSMDNRNLQIALSYIGRNLSKYITSYREVQGVKIFDWDLISNDTLLNANILVFKNNITDQIDVICLSNYSLEQKVKFNGQNNIMGSYVNDGSTDTKGLINFPANFANIEAMRAMTILNEVLPQINQSKLLLGELRVLSTFGTGDEMKYNMEFLNRDLFQEAAKIVKKNNSDFNFTNNFTKAKYVDPLDVLLRDYQGIISTSTMSDAEKQDLVDIGFNNLENLKTREAKKIELRAIIQKIYKMDPTIEVMTPTAILQCARSDSNPERKALAKLYILCENAFCYYSGIQVRREYKISKIYEYAMAQNRVPNKTYQGVTNMFTKTVDDVAARVKKEYNHIRDFTEQFYNAMGYGHLQASIVGNQAKAFRNLYRKDDSGKLLMEFRNPYETDSLPPLNQAESKYLKQVLFELAKIRSMIYGFDFKFNGYNDAELLRFIDQNKSWYFNPPLEKASQATIASNGFSSTIDEWSRRAKDIIKNPKQTINELINGIGTEQESELMEKSFNTLHLTNSFIVGDGYKGGESSRAEMINSHPQGFFETNVENLLAHYLERQVQVEEFNKTLIAVKGILLQLEMIGESAGEEHKAGLAQTTKMIQDFVKQNIFNQSIMEPESQKIMAWVYPFRQLVSKAYIAGNIVSMFRDTFEGMWQNTARMLTKYQTDIDAKSLTNAYKEVTKASFTSVRGITIIDELCKTYRLSNLDVARISEGLTTSSSGLLNPDKWMYYTLRAPDFLNRMVLFVAKCMKDGCWDAFDLDGSKLTYNWRKDKRYSVYADKSKKGTKEYEEQRIAYYNAIRQYNEEHPENTIGFDDDLPVAYSNSQVQQMRQLSNSIYGAYDRSMRAKYENTALGLTFAMFSTWMNGMVSNYFTKPGQYAGGPTTVEQDRDGSGNLLFMDKHGITVVELDNKGEKTYIYEETGEPVTDLEGMVPIMKEVPLVVQGIMYTLWDSIVALRKGEFVKEIWNNPMQAANLRKALSDLIAALLFFALFKWGITPMYKEFKKEEADHSVIENAMAEILYKSTSRSYDGFMGPVALIQFLGENTNPPIYQLSTKIPSDLMKFALGDKTFGELMTGNIALFRAVQDTYKGVLRTERALEREQEVQQ